MTPHGYASEMQRNKLPVGCPCSARGLVWHSCMGKRNGPADGRHPACPAACAPAPGMA